MFFNLYFLPKFLNTIIDTIILVLIVKKMSHFDASNQAWAKKTNEKSIRSDKVKIIFYSTSTHIYVIVYLQRRKDRPLEMFLDFKFKTRKQINPIIFTNFFGFKVAIYKLVVAFGHMPNLWPKDSYHIKLNISSICNLTNRCPTRCKNSNYLLRQMFNHVLC